jgi:predicted small lipoprotein YifL
MLKIEAKNMLILAVLSVLLSCGLVSGLDLHNTEKNGDKRKWRWRPNGMEKLPNQ